MEQIQWNHLVSRRNVIRGASGTLAAGIAGGRIGRSQGATPTPGAGADAADLDSFIAEAMERYGVPGAAVAVVHNNFPVLIRGYGSRDVGSDSPVDEDTIFQLASNTKPMTAFVLGSLIDEGPTGWDVPIIDALPELELMDSYATQHLTLRDAFDHRSGLPAFGGDLLAHIGYDRAELLRRLLELGQPDGAP